MGQKAGWETRRLLELKVSKLQLESCRQCWVGQDSGKSCLVIAELAIPVSVSAASSQMVCRKMLLLYMASGMVRQTTPEAIYRAMLLCSTVGQTTPGDGAMFLCSTVGQTTSGYGAMFLCSTVGQTTPRYGAILLCTALRLCWCVYQIWQCRLNKSLNSRLTHLLWSNESS